ncbi:unnamed protein product [Rhodiola kirilowii]
MPMTTLVTKNYICFVLDEPISLSGITNPPIGKKTVFSVEHVCLLEDRHQIYHKVLVYRSLSAPHHQQCFYRRLQGAFLRKQSIGRGWVIALLVFDGRFGWAEIV